MVFNEAWFTRNCQSTLPFNPAASLADRGIDKFMNERVTQTVLPSAVEVHVNLQGAYTVARLEEKAGANPGAFTLKAPDMGCTFCNCAKTNMPM